MGKSQEEKRGAFVQRKAHVIKPVNKHYEATTHKKTAPLFMKR